MREEVQVLLKPLIGLECCRVDVGQRKSLSIGFGERVYHGNDRLKTTFYGEWELGTYDSAWRVMQGRNIVLGKGDEGSSEALTEKLQVINLGKVLELTQPSRVDFLIGLENEISIAFFAESSSSDEDYFHVFMPGKKHLAVSNGGIWTYSDSNKPLDNSNRIQFTPE
jgi:hypothetical protein